MKEKEIKEWFDKFGIDWLDFDRWMNGQTVQVDEDNEIIYYPHDVDRFVKMTLDNVPTYFD